MNYNSFGIHYNGFENKKENHVKMDFFHLIFVSRVVQTFARISVIT